MGSSKPVVGAILIAEPDDRLLPLWHLRVVNHVTILSKGDVTALRQRVSLYSGSFTWEIIEEVEEGGRLAQCEKLLLVDTHFIPLFDTLKMLLHELDNVPAPAARTLAASATTLHFLDRHGTNLDHYMTRTCTKEMPPGAVAVRAADLNKLPNLSIIPDAVGVTLRETPVLYGAPR